METDRFRGLSSLYLAVFLLSLNGLFAKLIPLDALTITQLRSAVALFGFFLLAALRREPIVLENRKHYFPIAILGVLLGLHWATFFHAMQVSTVAIGMLSLYSFPVLTILLEPLYSKKRLQLGDIVVGVIALSGLAILLSQQLQEVSGSVVEGVLWGVLSALLFSLRNLTQKYFFREVPSLTLMLYQVGTIALMLLPVVDSQGLQFMGGVDWGVVVLLGVLSTATAHTLLTYSLKQLAVGSASLIGCLQPPLAAVLAAVFISEIPAIPVVIGGSVILGIAVFESLRVKR